MTDREDLYAPFFPLFARMTAAEGAERRQIRNELIVAHMPLAGLLARRLARPQQSLDDVEQVARLGLVKAVDRFDPWPGKEFLGFAVPVIVEEIRRYIRDNEWALSVPRRLRELHLRIMAERERRRRVFGRLPVPSELARELGLSVDEIYEGLGVANAYRERAVEFTVEGMTQDPSAEHLGVEDAALTMVDKLASLRPLMAKLSLRERVILNLRFFADLTQSQIADRLGLSQMHVSRLLTQTLARLREEARGDR